jgi:hypothetical protein
MRYRLFALLFLVAVTARCATLRDVVQAPRFSVASGRAAELRLLGPSTRNPLGGAALRLWARVENPNPLGVTLAGLTGNLFLENNRAAAIDFPMGVPLLASADTVIPLDISIGFNELPGLVDLASRLLTRNSVGYRLDGTVTVDAGVLGRPSFGPNTLLRGDVAIRR